MTCAFAVRGGLSKIAGVESVEVSLNKGIATVKLKPGNTVTPETLWETVRKHGFTPKETSVLVRGEPQGARFKVAGTNQYFDLASDPKSPKAADDLKSQSGKIVTAQGALTPGKDVKVKVPLQVRSIEKGR